MRRISIYQVCPRFSRQLRMSTMEVFLWQAWNENQWIVLLGYPTVSKMLTTIKHTAAEIILFLFRITAHHCIVHATQSNCCCKKSRFHCSRVMTPNNPVLNPIDYKISIFILQYGHKLWVNRIEKTSCYWQKSWKAFEWKYVISVSSFWLPNHSVMSVPKIVKFGQCLLEV